MARPDSLPLTGYHRLAKDKTKQTRRGLRSGGTMKAKAFVKKLGRRGA